MCQIRNPEELAVDYAPREASAPGSSGEAEGGNDQGLASHWWRIIAAAAAGGAGWAMLAAD